MAINKRLLELALKGLEVEKQRIDLEIASIQHQLRMESPARTAVPREKKNLKKKSTLSAAGRKRLSDVMKARWASKNPPIKFGKKKSA